MMMLQKILCVLILGVVSVTFCIRSGLGEGYQQVAGLIDLRTTYSDGAHDLNFLIDLAKKRGFEVLFINDHDRMTMEYGIFPLRNIIRKKEEMPSINSRGAKEYLQGIKLAAQQHPEIILIPGSETSPFYYWTGSPFKDNLTAHNWERHLLIMGLENPQDYKNLPILHNGLSTLYSGQLLPLSIFFMVLMLLGLILVRKKSYMRILGIVILNRPSYTKKSIYHFTPNIKH
jgi:hypothetical protein